MDPVEVVGSWVTRAQGTSPRRARRLLEAAYGAVALKGRLASGADVIGAQDRCNGAVASTIVDSLRHPERAVTVNVFMPCEMLHAMDVTPMFPEGVSVYVACTRCAEGFCSRAEQDGVPESFCSYHKLMLGMDAADVMPSPAMVANTTLACDANQVSFRAVAARGGVPHAVVDVPWGGGEADVAYVANQLREVGRSLEGCFGRPLDEERLREVCRRSRSTLEKVRDFALARGDATLGTTLTSELCLMVCTHVMLGTEAAETYVDDLLAALVRAPGANPSVPRIFWLHTLPNWQQAMGDLFDGARTAELVGCDMAYDSLAVLDQLDPEDPYGFMARRLVGSSFNGPARRRVDDALRWARAAKADGAVVFGHWGCKQTLGMAHMGQAVFEEAGIPMLALDGDGCDPRNAQDGQMVTRAQAFLESLGPGALKHR